VFSFKNIDLGDYLKSIKIATIVAAVAVASLSSQLIADAKDNQVKTIYHVYKGTTFVGNITDKEKAELDNSLQEKLTVTEAAFPTYNLEIDQDIIFIPEQVFQASITDNNTLEQLKNEIEIEAKTTALAIEGEQFIHMSSKEELEELIRNFKLQYMTVEELEQFESMQDQDLQPLSEVGKRVTNVELSKKIEIVESSTVPSDILTSDAALTFLNSGVKEVKAYSVKEGDVLGSIAAAHSLTTKDLIALNDGLTEDTVLQIGQEVNVTVKKPLLEVTVSREIYDKRPIAYERVVQKTDELTKGETKVKQEGQNGEATIHYTVKQKNGTQISQNVFSEVITKESISEIILEGTKNSSVGTGNLVWPTGGGYVSSKQGQRWGKYHKGIDIARPGNRTIKAADNGVVVSAGYDNGGYGNKIVINHNNGMKTVYAHLASISVKPGQVVEAGSTIGVMGSTGDSTGVHLHFEVYKNGSLVNPLDYL